MREILLRVVAPAAVATFETEAPTTIVSTASSDEEADRLDAWIRQSSERHASVEAAIADRTRGGGRSRQIAWAEELGISGGGVNGAIERHAELVIGLERQVRELERDVRELRAELEALRCHRSPRTT
jgi:hypothetical protein